MLENFQQTYRDTKETLLTAAAGRAVSVEQVDTLLDALSLSRRMVEQIAKAHHLLTAVETDGVQAPQDENRDPDTISSR